MNNEIDEEEGCREMGGQVRNFCAYLGYANTHALAQHTECSTSKPDLTTKRSTRRSPKTSGGHKRAQSRQVSRVRKAANDGEAADSGEMKRRRGRKTREKRTVEKGEDHKKRMRQRRSGKPHKPPSGKRAELNQRS